MLKCHIDDGKVEVETTGSILDSTFDICMLAGSIYYMLQKRGLGEEKLFKICMMMGFSPDASTWRYEPDSGTSVVVPGRKGGSPGGKQ